MSEEKTRQLALILGGVFVIVALARFFPQIGGMVLLAVVLVMLFAAERAGVFDKFAGG